MRSVYAYTFEMLRLFTFYLHQVWRSCVSDGERNYLKQFLPEGIDVEEVVEQLLDGENFHFGNPFLDWLVTRDWTFVDPCNEICDLEFKFLFQGNKCLLRQSSSRSNCFSGGMPEGC